MKSLKKITGLLLTVIAVCAVFALSIGAADTALKVEYVFTGEDAEKPGYAEGTITVTPEEGANESGKYVLYFADDNGVLEGYKALGTLDVTGGPVTLELGRKTALPEGASAVAVFETADGKVSDTSLDNAATAVIPEAKRFDCGAVEYRFASLSDLHMNNSGARTKWTNALNYFEDIGVTYVACSGDYTDNGTDSEFGDFAGGITDSRYTGKIGGSIGNHDTGNKENFKKYFGQSEIYYYEIAENGDVFIYMAEDTMTDRFYSSVDDVFSTEQLDWLEGLLKKYSGTGVNIFIYEHALFYNWGPGDIVPGLYGQPLRLVTEHPNVMRFMALLYEYREAIMCSGHTHVAFSENVNFDDNGGSSARMIHNSSLSSVRHYNKTRTVLNEGGGGSEGYIVSVYGDAVVFRGYDLAAHECVPTACFLLEKMNVSHDAVEGLVSISPAEECQTEFSYGSLPQPGAIVLDAVFADGHTEKITSGFSYVLFDKDTVGVDQKFIGARTERILVSYGGKWTIFGITQKNVRISIPEGTKEIGNKEFRAWKALESVTIPDSVVAVGDEAFKNCTSLSEINWGKNITRVGYDAFAGTAFADDPDNYDEDGMLYAGNCLLLADPDFEGAYAVKAGTKCIADCAFVDCIGLTSIIIPEGTVGIGEETFCACENLASAYIPESVTFIGEITFEECAPDFVIYGKAGSYAQSYAEEYGYDFAELPDAPAVKGDADGDGELTGADAVLLLRSILLPELYSTADGFENDVNGDGSVDTSDAVRLLRYFLLPDVYPI